MIRAALIGATLGVTFTIGAAVADILSRNRLPHPHVYADLNEYLSTLST